MTQSFDFPQIEDAWVWPESVERWFRDRIHGRTLHVCCGKSNLGDVTVDADPANDPDIVADAKTLPFNQCSFDTAIIDPPWKINIFHRAQFIYPTIEAVKPNGKVLTNTTWIPQSNQIQLNDMAVRQDHSQGTVSVLAEFCRYPGQQTLQEVEA